MSDSGIVSPVRRGVREAIPGTVLALGTGIAGVAGSFAAAGSTLAFVGAPVAGFLVRNMPSAVISAAIVYLGDLGQRLNAVAAVGLAGLLLATAAGAAMRVGGALDSRSEGDPPDPYVRVALVGLVVTVLSAILTGALVPSVAAGVAGALVPAAAAVAPALSRLPDRLDLPDVSTREATDAGDPATIGKRRRLLGGLAGTIGVGVLGYLFGRGREPGHGNPASLDLDGSEHGEIQELLSTADRRSLDVDGLEPLVSRRFYEVDINTINPTVNAEDWTLSVTGAVPEDVTFSYGDLLAMEPEHRFVSLRCVGERLNGQKMDNALWTGVPVTALLERAGLELEECCVMLRAADDYYEEFPIDALRDGFLAYGMNGHELPRAHGYPVRALIPGHWGEINVKWLTEIEVLPEERTGYWEKRGWHGTGPVNTVAKLHVIDRLGGRIRVAGHAYAGTRGVSAVEVSTDGGETWREATLSTPLPGEDVWRQWSYTYDTPDDEHEVVVRAIDGTGTVQPRTESGPYPSGPTGWVSTTLRP